MPAHLQQPRCGHRRPDPVVVDKHGARAPNGEECVGFLHELSAGRRARVRKMPGGELLRCPDIEDIQITVRRFAPPFVERLGIDRSDAETFRDARRRRQRLFQTRLRDFRRTPRRALDDVEAGQMPVLRPVFQGHHSVGNAGVDQRLGADDAAGAAAAIDDYRRIGRGRQIGETVHDLRAGHAHGAGNTVAVELFVGARVEDRDIGAVVDQRFQILRGNPWCRRLMFDDFREGLAGNMDAAIDVKTGFLPAGDAAFQKRNTGIPKF